MGLIERLFRRGTPQGLPQVPNPTDAPLTQPPIARPRRPDRTYRVKEGDTLQTIAREVYGDDALWTRIAETNRQRIGDPPVLYPGLKLTLP